MPLSTFVLEFFVCLCAKCIKINASILFTPWCEYETWSVTLREEHSLRVFENRLLRVYERKRKVVTGDWRKMHDELHGLYF